MTRVFAGSVNFRDGSGRWAAIDNALEPVAGGYRNRANRFALRLPSRLAGGEVSVRDGDDRVAFSLRDAEDTEGVVKGARVTYPAAFAGVDVSYEAKADFLKELITLKSASARRSFVFDLKLSDGLRPDLLASGDLAIRDRDDALVMSVPAPFMTDAGGAESHAVEFDLARVERGWRLTLTASDAWLDSPGREWPVQVDPQVFPAGQVDCKIDQGTPNTSYCSSTDLAVGGSPGAEKRSVLRFDIAGAVPPGSRVTHAALGLKVQGQSTAQAKLVNVHKLTTSFASTATWSSPWTSQGGDYGSAVECETCATLGGAAGGAGTLPGSYAYWNMRALVDGWASGAANNGLLVKADSMTSGGNVITLGSGEVPGSEPFIDVRFERRTGVVPANKYESQKISDRISLAVNSATGNVLVRQRELTVPGGVGPDLTIARSYNSKQPGWSAYGTGWGMDSGPDVAIETTPIGDVVFYGPSGLRAFFARSSVPGEDYKTPPGFDAKLAKRAGGAGWTYTENESQRKLTFDDRGRLERDEDRNNRAMTFAYSSAPSPNGYELASITDSQGRATTFGYTNGFVTQMTDSGGRVYKYFYTADLLTKYTDPAGNDTLYSYDASDRLQLITTPAGHKTKITYDAPGWPSVLLGRVASIIRVTNPTAAFASMTGPTTLFSYTQNPDGSGQGVVTSPKGDATTTNYDTQSRPIDTTDAHGHKTSQTYTSNSNVQNFTLAGTGTGTTPNTAMTYDTTNNLTGAHTPTTSGTSPTDCTNVPTTPCIRSSANYGEAAGVASTVAGYQYLQTSSKDPQDRTKTFGYDAKGNPTSIGSTLGAITLAYATGSTGKLASITDARGKTTSYGYDSAGNMTTITPPLPLGSTVLTYTASLSRVATVKDANAKVRTLTHDSLDRVTKITYAGGSYVQFVYDKDGNLTARNDTVAGNSTYTYDELSRVTNEALPGGISNTYGYDAASNLTSLTDASGATSYHYDKANLNDTVADPAQTLATGSQLGYDSDHRPDVTTYPNGAKVIRGYDHAGRLTAVQARNPAGALIEDRAYTYADSGGQRVLRLSMIDAKAGTTTAYTYDTLNRLTRARTYTTNTSTPDPLATCAGDARRACYEYTLDATGNRTERKVTGSDVTNSTTTMTYNNANQLTSKTGPGGTSTYNYDLNGNQTTRTGAAPRTLGYNVRDQTTSIAGTTMGYLGAGQDQLVTQGATANNLRHNVLGLSRRDSGGTTSYYTRDAYGNPLAQRTGGTREYYIPDALGSIVRTIDGTTSATTTSTNNYDPDGNTTATTGSSTNPLKYTAGYQAPAGLYHYGQRYYDPTDARWTQPDPLNQATDLLEANRYPYVGGDPINLIDPTGTISCSTVGLGGVCKTTKKIGRSVGRVISTTVNDAGNGGAGGALVGCAIGAVASEGVGCKAGAAAGGVAGALGGGIYGVNRGIYREFTR